MSQALLLELESTKDNGDASLVETAEKLMKMVSVADHTKDIEEGQVASSDVRKVGSDVASQLAAAQEQKFYFWCLCEDLVTARVRASIKEMVETTALAESEGVHQLCARWASELVKSAFEDMYQQGISEAELTVDKTQNILVFKLDDQEVNYDANVSSDVAAARLEAALLWHPPDPVVTPKVAQKVVVRETAEQAGTQKKERNGTTQRKQPAKNRGSQQRTIYYPDDPHAMIRCYDKGGTEPPLIAMYAKNSGTGELKR